ncbi:MAG: 50S ribosomal protein L18 [bacterium]
MAKKRARRSFRVKNKQTSRGVLLRLSVYRSLKHIYAQIIDDAAQKTLLTFSSLMLQDKSGDKKEVAKKVGLELGKIALDKSIDQVLFDRGRFLYHGRIKALAEGARQSGLKF